MFLIYKYLNIYTYNYYVTMLQNSQHMNIDT